jgi:tetratricopeptide (TPR) repeat protein
MATDWFRRSTWTPGDQADFNSHLGRSRPHNRSQYLRIQAHHLAEAGRDVDALALLDRLIAEYPDRLQLAEAHKQRGDCLSRLGCADEALGAYGLAIDAQRAVPNVRTAAPLDYAFTVARLARRELYDQALTVLEEFAADAGSVVLPYEQFYRSAARALIWHARTHPGASGMAKRALEAASATYSGFARHPKFGLVGRVDDQVLERLRRVAAS